MTLLQQKAVAPPRMMASFSMALPGAAGASGRQLSSPTPGHEPASSSRHGDASSSRSATPEAGEEPSTSSPARARGAASVSAGNSPNSMSPGPAAPGAGSLRRNGSGGSIGRGAARYLAVTLEEESPVRVSPSNSFVSVSNADCGTSGGRRRDGRLSEGNMSVGSTETDPGAAYHKVSPNRSLAGSPQMGHPMGRSSTPDWARDRTPPGTPEMRPRTGGPVSPRLLTPESLSASLAAMATIAQKGTAGVSAGARAAEASAGQPPQGLADVLHYMAADPLSLQLQTQGIFAIRSLSGISAGAAAGAAEAGAVDSIVLAMARARTPAALHAC